MDNAPLVSIRTRHVSRAWSVTGLGVSTPSPNVATQTQIVTEPRADVALLQLITVLVDIARTRATRSPGGGVPETREVNLHSRKGVEMAR